ncbi:MAG: hypothetical protein ACYTG6_16345 [Planctomycetota bacterium]|jgi:hypothetical protein
MSPRLNSSSPSWQALLPWVGGLSTLALAFGLHLGAPHGLWADGGVSQAGFLPRATVDTDGDGLVDVLEEVLWLDQDRADSDGDGWGDAEELARSSDPKDRSSVPDPREIGLGVQGYSIDGRLHVVLAIYQRGGVGADHTFDLAAVVEGRLIPLDPRVYVPFTTVTVVPGAVPEDTVHLLDMNLPGRVLRHLRQVSFALRGAHAGSQEVDEAAVLNVVVASGSPYAVGVSAIAGQGAIAKGKGQTLSTIYNSLVPPSRSQPGSSSSSGKVCVQRTTVVGGGGASLLLEVVSGSCQDGDGVCPSSCSSTPGSTVRVVDPLALIGG